MHLVEKKSFATQQTATSPSTLPMASHAAKRRIFEKTTLHVAIASLAIGGAEKIVIDWINRLDKSRFSVKLALLHDQEKEFPVPDGVELFRFHGKHISHQLHLFTSNMRSDDVLVTHLIHPKYLHPIKNIRIIPVIHNAKDGWRSDPKDYELCGAVKLVAVSEAAKNELREHGVAIPLDVTRHVTSSDFAFNAADRNAIRKKWGVQDDELLILCSGRLKPQKNYTEAVKTLKSCLDQGLKSKLVILGGHDGEEGKKCYLDACKSIADNKLLGKVIMPGFVSPASPWLSAADVFLNVSNYEGISIATIEALQAGLRCVVRNVGGQSEIRSERLEILDKEATPADFANRIASLVKDRKAETIPSFGAKLWTHHSLMPAPANNGVLFITSNLNAGGAQRSLVKIAKEMHGNGDKIKICVQMNSTNPAFLAELERNYIDVFSVAKNDIFEFTDGVLLELKLRPVKTVCFWNLDVRAKTLVAKALRGSGVKVVDANPGHYTFTEMLSVSDFMQTAGESPESFHECIDELVFKYTPRNDEIPSECNHAKSISSIPNGVPLPRQQASERLQHKHFLVCGRLAHSKRPELIIEAFTKARIKVPELTLTFIGAAEPAYADLSRSLSQHDNQQKGIIWKGQDFDAPEKMHSYDALIVIGTNQGCPNTTLEGLAARIPVIANDSGGTREQIINDETGILLREDCSADELMEAILKIAENPNFSNRIAANGFSHVKSEFSMTSMLEGWKKVLLD